MVLPAENDRLGFPTVLQEGVVIAAILVTWGIIAIVGIGIRNIGGPGGFLISLGDAITQLFIIVGIANVLLYIVARGLQLSRLPLH